MQGKWELHLSSVVSPLIIKYKTIKLKINEEITQNKANNKKKQIRGATAPKSQDRLKWLLPDGSTGHLVVSKALIPQP